MVEGEFALHLEVFLCIFVVIVSILVKYLLANQIIVSLIVPTVLTYLGELFFPFFMHAPISHASNLLVSDICMVLETFS